MFLSGPLPPVYHVSKTVLQIKHYTVRVIMSYLSFCSRSNAPWYIRVKKIHESSLNTLTCKTNKCICVVAGLDDLT